MKKVEYILNIKIEKVKEEIRISQRAYVIQMLEKFDIVECKPQSISLLVKILLSTINSPETQEKTNKIKKIPYYKALGLLIWLQVVT